MATKRKYPVGIQSFEKLRKDGYIYIDMLTQLKVRYDGYHFGRAMKDIYNPFSLINAFNSGEISDYWFDRGTSSALIDMLAQMPPVEITELDGILITSKEYPNMLRISL